MIIKAACRLNNEVRTALRHFIILKDAIPFGSWKKSEQGFVTDTGEFLNRRDAAKHAIDCGQVVPGKAKVNHIFNGHTLYSEDLW